MLGHIMLMMIMAYCAGEKDSFLHQTSLCCPNIYCAGSMNLPLHANEAPLRHRFQAPWISLWCPKNFIIVVGQQWCNPGGLLTPVVFRQFQLELLFSDLFVKEVDLLRLLSF